MTPDKLTAVAKARAAGIYVSRPCTNDDTAKRREIVTAIDVLASNSPSILSVVTDLYRDGVFRHYEDVAYARIMLERGETRTQIAKCINDNSHCDGVRPPAAAA